MSAGDGSRLLDHHRERLELASGLSVDVIAARGYYSVESRDELKGQGFPRDVGPCLPAIAIPVYAVRHLEPGGAYTPTGLLLRPDTLYSFPDGRAAKYLHPIKQANTLDVHPLAREWLVDAAVPLTLTEGVIKADSAVSVGLAAIGLGGVDGGWRNGAPLPEWELVPLKGRQVLIAFDSDITLKKSVRGGLQRITGYLQRRGAGVEVVVLPPGLHGAKVGLDDFLAAHRGSTHPIGLLLEHAMTPESVPEEGAEAVPALPADITGADVLQGTCDLLMRYIHFPRIESAWTATLWVAHTHFVTLFELVAYLAVQSATMRAGKTHLLDLVRWTSARGRRMSGASVAAIFRSLDADPPPTFVFDEVDRYIGENSERNDLIGMLNEGFERDGTVARVEETGGKREAVDFNVFGPKAFTGIGAILPATTLDRCIRLKLERRLRSERIGKWRARHVREQAHGVRDLLAGWAATALDTVEEHYGAELEFAPGTSERAEDLWEPLLAVAAAAGGEWPQRARRAALALTPPDDDTGDTAIVLLADIRRVFEGEEKPEAIKSGALVTALNGLEEAPWGGLRDGKGLSTHRLASDLTAFGLAPERDQLKGEQVRGWWRRSFEPVWDRYLPSDEGTQETPQDVPVDAGNSETLVSPDRSVYVSELGGFPLNQAVFDTDTLDSETELPEQSVWAETPANRHFPDTQTLRIAETAETQSLAVVDEPFPLLEEHAQTVSIGDGPALRVEHVPPERLEQRDRFRGFLTSAFENATPLAVDLEATGKDPHAKGFAVRLWSVSDGQTAFVVDARDECSCGLVHALLSRYPRLLVHNGFAYDLAVAVRTLGVDVGGVSRRARELRLVDTVVLSRLVHPDAKRIGLKEMSTLYFGDGAADPERLLKRSFRSTRTDWASIDASHPALIAYAGADAALTQRLHERLRGEAGSDRLLELEHRVAAICLRSGLRGFAVDPDAAVVLEERLGAEQQRLEKALAGRGIVRIATDAGRASIIAALEREGLQVENGKLDRSLLAPLAAAGSDVARDVLGLRTAAKFRALYARMFTRALEQDGRLHAYARSLAAVTGRMAISGVPLQTAPKEIELGGELNESGRLAVRDVLVADPGCVVGSIDYRAMELRLAAGLSGDVSLRAVVDAGDPHLEVARALFNAEPTSRQRAIAKTVNFAAMYGMQPYGLSVRLGISVGQARSFLDSWWARFPELQRYAAELSDDDRSPWGRRLPVEARPHAKLNHRIQAAGRDIFCAGLLRLEDAGLVDQLVLPLHDEYVLTVPEREARELVARAAAIVRNELGGVPLPVDANVGGRSWGSAK